jgi:hypothetical protein
MDGTQAHAVNRSVGRRAAVLVAGVALLLTILLYAGAPSKAHATNFCTNVWLQPYGQAGDRCTAAEGGYIGFVTVVTHERAGCESVANNGVVLEPWTCIGPNNYLGTYHDNTRWSHGIIRNNNLSSAGHFDGGQ